MRWVVAIMLVSMLMPWMRGGATAASGDTFVPDYYISSTGLDSNDGLTPSTAWPITTLLPSTATGYTSTGNTHRSLLAEKNLQIQDGAYYIASYAAGINDSDTVLLTVPAGSSGAPTRVRGQSRNAIIDGSDGSGNRTDFYANAGKACGIIGQTYVHGDRGYMQIENLTIRNGYRYLVHFRMTGAPQDGPRISGIKIIDCDITDIHSDGNGTEGNTSLIEAYNCDGLTVTNCYLHLARGDRTISEQNGHAIQTWCCNNSVFEHNDIADCIHPIYVKNQTQTGVIVRYNYIDNSSYGGAGSPDALHGMGFSNAGENHADIHHNLLIAASGWRVVGDLGTILQGPCAFYNNTVVATSTSFAAVGVEMMSANAYNQKIYNNLLIHSGSSTAEYGDICSTVGRFLSDRNFYAGSPKMATAPTTGDPTYPTASYSSLAAWQTASSQDANSFASNTTGIKATGSAKTTYYQPDTGSNLLNNGRVVDASWALTSTACHIGAWDGVITSIGCDWR